MSVFTVKDLPEKRKVYVGSQAKDIRRASYEQLVLKILNNYIIRRNKNE